MSAEEVLNRVVRARDAFESLGVLRSYNVDDAGIRAAFRAAALLLHPDKLPPHLSIDRAVVDKYSHAFVKLSESYAAIKTESDRHELIRRLQEEDMLRQMQLRDIRDQASAEPQQRAARPATKPSTVRKPPTASFGSSPSEAASAPRASFPGFAGGKVRVAPSKGNATSSRPLHSDRTTSSAAPSSSAASAPSRPPASTFSSAAAAASRQSDPVDVTSSGSTEDFLAQLLKWKLAFKVEMESERDLKSQSVLDTYGSQSQLRAMQSKIGASIFIPPQISARSSTALQSLGSTKATESSASRPVAVEASSVSRLQEMRARQQGLSKTSTTSVPNSTAQSTSSSSSISTLPPSVTIPLTAGSRFRLRTVKAPGETPTPPVYVSVWVDQSIRLLQWRLTTSLHSHPDGVLSIDRIADVRRMSKPVGDLWWSAVMSDGQSMCFEATSTEARETWVNCLSSVLRAMKA